MQKQQKQISLFDWKPQASHVRVDALVILRDDVENGKAYRNRKGGKVEIFYDGRDPNYPFTDGLGVTYNKNGKVYAKKECHYDLIEAV